jgi:hypothetical protein
MYRLLLSLFCVFISVSVRAGTTSAPGGKTSPTLSVEAAQAVLEFEQAKQPDRKLSWDLFQKNFEVVHGRVRKSDLASFINDFAPRDIQKVREELDKSRGFQGIKIRESYADTLTSEDPTVQLEGKDQPQSAKDLKGASFSYQHDFKADIDTWAAKGALIFPFLGRSNATPHLGDPLVFTTYGVIPSVSFDREVNGADKSKDVDSLIFRAGFFAKMMSGGFLRAQTFRIFGTYGTDFELKSETPAVEFEWEPVLFFGKRLGTGSTHSLLEKRISDDELKTTLAYQLRAYLHGEYGRTVDAGGMTGVPEQDFFRIGPRLELTLDPLFSDRVTASMSYEYLADVVGTTLHRHHFKASAEYRITTEEDAKKNPYLPIFGIKATYEDGGLDLTKEEVRTLLVGLAITL